jgi:protein-disulfide isomerase
MDLLKKYKGKIRFIYKHLPLSFHANAMNAAKYYEAVRLQSHDKAIKFHDKVYKNQKKLKKGEVFLRSVAKKLGVNMTKLKSDINSDKVMARIKEDMAEAAKFGFQGTPGFTFNGIPVKGAYPVTYFNGIVEELKKRGKVKL